jgi:hypothetical protein
MNEWYNILVLVVLLPFIGLTIICLLLLVESPNYFFCKGSKKNCIDSLTTIAMHNGKEDWCITLIQKIINDTSNTGGGSETNSVSEVYSEKGG